MLRKPTAGREVRENNDCAESELVNHLSPEVRPFPKFVCSGTPQTFHEMFYAYIHAVHL